LTVGKEAFYLRSLRAQSTFSSCHTCYIDMVHWPHPFLDQFRDEFMRRRELDQPKTAGLGLPALVVGSATEVTE
jgi:hypothetical protein